jgi:hypothetical protein
MSNHFLNFETLVANVLAARLGNVIFFCLCYFIPVRLSDISFRFGFPHSYKEHLDDTKAINNSSCDAGYGYCQARANACLSDKFVKSSVTPVTMRNVYTHLQQHLSWNMNSVGSNDFRNNVTGPSDREDQHLLKAKMRNQKTITAGQDYEYICLPWKRNCKMEDVFQYLSEVMGQHDYMVECRDEYQWDMQDEEELPFWLEKINPYARKLTFSFKLEDVLKDIAFVKSDPGRQLLTGSFHPVDDEVWDKGVKLAQGSHTFVRIVLEEIHYEETTPWDFKLISADFVRKAVSKILKLSHLSQYFFANKTVYENSTQIAKPPVWWKSRLVLVTAATPEQVKEFQLTLEYATCEIFETFSYETFTINVGADQPPLQISLAQAMAQPALNRCMACGLELLMPNRCVSYVFV